MKKITPAWMPGLLQSLFQSRFTAYGLPALCTGGWHGIAHSACLSVLLIALLPWWSASAQETPAPPLDVDASALDATHIQLFWRIPDQHFLIRNKLRLRTTTPDITLGEAVYPAGTQQEIQPHGSFEVYRDQLTLTVPLTRTSPQAMDMELVIQSQGCGSDQQCYPQQERTVTVALPALNATQATAASVGATLDRLRTTPAPADSAGLALLKQEAGDLSENNGFLPPEQAFALDAQATAANLVTVSWKIAEGYYLYRDQLHFALEGLESEDNLQPPRLPPGEDKEDQEYGRVQVFYQFLEVPLWLRQAAPGREVTLVVRYQGCASAGLCYPPEEQRVRLTLPMTEATPQSNPVGQTTPALAQSEQDRITGMLMDSHWAWIILVFFGLGLLLAFTPCVLPMIPILSGILVGQGQPVTPWRGFMISLAYVLAMAITYAIAGVMAGLAGQNLQNALQTPWVLGAFSLTFVLLALSMFGFYELQMPSFVQSRLAMVSNRQQSGTLLGASIMGFLSALIVGPCVAAPLAGALLYINQTGNWPLGGIAMFALSLGMGAPLLLVGASAGTLLPRAGAWMESIKAVFGVLLLALAIWMMERVLPPVAVMLAWAILLIVSGVFLGALDTADNGWRKLWKGVGVVALVYGVMLLIGAASGQHDPLQPLAGNSTSVPEKNAALPFQRIASIAELDAALAVAKAQGQWVMMDFYADWCVSCKEMEKITFADPQVRSALAGAMLLQADVTANRAEDKALLKKFNLFGPPGIIFYTPQGQELSARRIVGYLPPEPFLAHLRQIFSAPSTQ